LIAANPQLNTSLASNISQVFQEFFPICTDGMYLWIFTEGCFVPIRIWMSPADINAAQNISHSFRADLEIKKLPGFSSEPLFDFFKYSQCTRFVLSNLYALDY
jgi:hypothetical protein